MKIVNGWRNEYVELVFSLNKNSINLEEAKKLLEKNKPEGGKLYKYRRGGESDIENLINDKLWVPRPDEFNDPYDCALFIDSEELLYMAGNEVGELDEMRKTINEFEKSNLGLKMPDIDKILSIMGAKANEALQPTLSELRNSLGIYCLTEEKESILMWSHYAENHKGFCVEYDFEDFQKKFSDFYPVAYDEEYCGMSGYIWNQDSNIIMRSALSKANQWNYEKEWRIILKNNKADKGHVIDSPKVKSIYLGCKATNELENELKEIAKNKNIPIYKMKMMKNKFKLDSSSSL